jgi:hypothetical protein
MSAQPASQTKADREYILENLPEGTHRVQVTNATGGLEYKRPEEVDVVDDKIMLNSKGEPILMMGKPGRKKKPLAALSPQLAAVAQAREDHLESNVLVSNVKKEANGDDALDEIILGLSQEAAVLEFDRLEAQRHGDDGAPYAVKRARILRSMGDLILKRRALSKGSAVDMDSDEFQALFTFLLETFRGAMEESGCRPELIETTFTKLTGNLDDSWAQEAKGRMKDVAKP